MRTKIEFDYAHFLENANHFPTPPLTPVHVLIHDLLPATHGPRPSTTIYYYDGVRGVLRNERTGLGEHIAYPSNSPVVG